ncbi:MAG: hypothetical protein ACFFAN_05545 [Promethearchaeota archaeon]
MAKKIRKSCSIYDNKLKTFKTFKRYSTDEDCTTFSLNNVSIFRKSKDKSQKLKNKQKKYLSILQIDKKIEITYPLSDNDNAGTKLIKRLLNIIHSNEVDIVKLHRDKLNNRFGFSFIKGQNRFRHAISNNISIRNLVKILGVTRNTLSYWLKIIKQTNSKPAEYNYKAGMRESILNKIKTRIKEMLYYGTTLTIYEYLVHAIQEFEQDVYKTNEFQDELISIFNKYQHKPNCCYIDSKFLTKVEISRLLGMNDFYITSLGYWGERERLSKFLKLLTRIHLFNSKKLILNEIRKESHELVYNKLKNLGLLKENMRSTFDIVVFSLVALSKAKSSAKGDKFVIVSCTELSKIISYRNSKYLLNEKFKNGTPIRPIQVRRIIRELRKNYFNAEKLCRDTILKLKNYARSNFKSKKRFRDYFIYFEELKILHLKELFDITLGLDVYKLQFIKEEINETPQEFVKQIKRHHLDKDQKYYLIFHFDKNEKNYSFKLTTLSRCSHWEIHDSNDFEQEAFIINYRLKHLYQLAIKNFNPCLDYKKIISKDFYANRANWKGLKNEVIHKLVERWIIYKKNDVDFYKRFYPKFYGTFKFMVKDMHLFEEKSSECKFPDFWFWYFNTYYLERNLIYKKLEKLYS